MAMYSALDFLKRKDELTWEVVRFGFRSDLLSHIDVGEVATEWLSNNLHCDSRPIVYLASCDSDSRDDVLSWLDELCSSVEGDGETKPSELWRWARLSELGSDDELDDDAKFIKLQELHCEFGYPSDMAECSEYSVEPGLSVGEFGKCPLVALQEVIVDLGRRLFG